MNDWSTPVSSSQEDERKGTEAAISIIREREEEPERRLVDSVRLQLVERDSKNTRTRKEEIERGRYHLPLTRPGKRFSICKFKALGTSQQLEVRYVKSE